MRNNFMHNQQMCWIPYYLTKTNDNLLNNKLITKISLSMSTKAYFISCGLLIVYSKPKCSKHRYFIFQWILSKAYTYANAFN